MVFQPVSECPDHLVQLFGLVTGGLFHGPVFLFGFDLPAVQLIPERNNHILKLADFVVRRTQGLLEAFLFADSHLLHFIAEGADHLLEMPVFRLQAVQVILFW
jgi:hypothetical protein